MAAGRSSATSYWVFAARNHASMAGSALSLYAATSLSTAVTESFINRLSSMSTPSESIREAADNSGSYSSLVATAMSRDVEATNLSKSATTGAASSSATLVFLSFSNMKYHAAPAPTAIMMTAAIMLTIIIFLDLPIFISFSTTSLADGVLR